jgi:hypothetical protein
MKKTRFFSLMTAALLFGLVACDNAGDNNNNKDTVVTTNTGSNNAGDYAAKADEIEKNSEAGKYVDVRTGKPVRLSMDRSTGRISNAENSEPVTRYVYIDNSDWWLYDSEGTQLGKAKWENDKMWFDDNGNWVEYDTKWKDDSSDTKVKSDGDESKIKSGDTKIKTEKDGDQKIKTKDSKVKTDEDGTKVKDN